jgi:hypothetical protein
MLLLDGSLFTRDRFGRILQALHIQDRNTRALSQAVIMHMDSTYNGCASVTLRATTVSSPIRILKNVA